MRPYNQIRDLKTEEREALLKGTRSKSGFTVRRSHILLLNAEGQSAPTIANRLHCSEQMVRNVIRAFNREGIACLEEKSHRPHHDHHVFSEEGLKRLRDLVHRSPRDFKFETSLWTLDLLAKACFQEQIVTQPISYETVRRGLLKLGIDWRSARHRITSHDPQYEVKKTTAAVDGVGNPFSQRRAVAVAG